MSTACFPKRGLASLNSKLLASGVIPLHQLSQQRSALGLATADPEYFVQRQLLIQSLQESFKLSHLQSLFWQSFERNRILLIEANPTSSGSPQSSAESLAAKYSTQLAWWRARLLPLCEGFSLFTESHWWKSSLGQSEGDTAAEQSPGSSLQSQLSLIWLGGFYHTYASSSPKEHQKCLATGWTSPYVLVPERADWIASRRAGQIETVSTHDWTREPSLYRFETCTEVDVEAYWRDLDSQPHRTASSDSAAQSDPTSAELPSGSFPPDSPSADPNSSNEDAIAGEANQGQNPPSDGTSNRTSNLSESSGSGRKLDRKNGSSKQGSLSLDDGSSVSANNVTEIIDIVTKREQLDFMFASKALYLCARQVGVKKSEKANLRGNYRSTRFYDRQILKRSLAFRRLITSVMHGCHKSRMPFLISLVWSLSALRLTGAAKTTPECMKCLAKELEARGSNGSFEFVAPHQLSMSAYGLQHNMRSDAPWHDLLQLLVDGLVCNREETLAGPASSMLNSIATYKVVFDKQPVSDDGLAFLCESLAYTDPYSPGPQAISQGIYTLAKLGYSQARLPRGCNLSSLVDKVIKQIDKDNPVHCQAVANVFWALAELDFSMTSIQFKQLMLITHSHAYHFQHKHFGQVFHALRKYGFVLTREQVENFGRAILISVPLYPDKVHILKWQSIMPDLQRMVRELKLNGEEPPKAVVEAMSALQHLNNQPRIRIQKRRNVLKQVFPEKWDPNDIAKEGANY